MGFVFVEKVETEGAEDLRGVVRLTTLELDSENVDTVVGGRLGRLAGPVEVRGDGLDEVDFVEGLGGGTGLMGAMLRS